MTKPLSARLAPVLKLSAEATEDDVTDSVRVLAAQSTRLTASLRRVLKLADGATDEEMVGAVESAVSGAADAESAKELASAFEELKAALGAANIPELLARCTKLIQQAKENEGLVESLSSQLSGIKSQLSQAEVKDAKAQIAALSASHGVDPKGVMMMLTSAIGTDEKGVEFVRPGSLEGIFKVYPPSEAKPAASVAVPDALKTLLTSSVVAGPGGEQRGGVVTGVATAPVQAAAVDDSAHAKVQADIMLCSGFNHVEKTVSYLLGKEKRFEELAPADQIRVASRFYTSGQLLI
jgi:hypothetical protein